jgi:hypothetical protein
MMTKRKLELFHLLAIAVVTITSAGCSSSYKFAAPTVVGDRLDASRGVAISKPANGVFNGTAYGQSGRMTADAVRSAFARHADHVALIANCHGPDCLGHLDSATFGYYVQPEILHWEDRATEWSGKSDRVEIRMTVYDTATSERLAHGTYSGKSKWATFGGDHPQDLLAKPTGRFVADLYQQPE